MTKPRTAIIGTGISGLTCGYLLNPHHDIKVFEANHYIGGHTNTVDVTVDEKHYAIDTGFIVFNDWTYPNFIKLMNQLGVEQQATEMSFSVKNTTQNLEYNGHNLDSLFAQRRNTIRPTFWRMLKDIIKFNKLCKQAHAENWDLTHITLQQFIEQHRLGRTFADNYIYPMCSAIWSGSLDDMRHFPMRFFIQFFTNHGLLNIKDRPQWYTLVGGSRSYIDPITAKFRDKILLNCPVKAVRKQGDKWLVEADSGSEPFDKVIMACHSDQALALLAQPSSAQQEVLGKLTYSENEVVLHTDTDILPKRKKAWASWNYHLDAPTVTSHTLSDEQEQHNGGATVTYNMNILQNIRSDTTFCVTLNHTHKIDPSKILRTFNYAHPQFNADAIDAQNQRAEINGIDNLYFCGAYWYNGFHEDGVNSALDVCRALGVDF